MWWYAVSKDDSRFEIGRVVLGVGRSPIMARNMALAVISELFADNLPLRLHLAMVQRDTAEEYIGSDVDAQILELLRYQRDTDGIRVGEPDGTDWEC